MDIINHPNNGGRQKIEDIAFVCLFRGYWTATDETWVCDTY